jgi:uncharacterized protein YutE (UPF0331/DUF86 family)
MSREVGLVLLAQMRELLDRLRKFQKVDDPSKFIDFDLGAERLIALLVETANDLLCHLFLSRQQPVPANYYDVFGEAGRIGWIPEDLAERLQQAGKMRNILIHAYGRIDPEVVRKSIPVAMKDFRQFLKVIKPLVDKLPEKSK